MVDSVGLADRRAISAAERVRYREVTRPFALCQRVWPCETNNCDGQDTLTITATVSDGDGSVISTQEGVDFTDGPITLEPVPDGDYICTVTVGDGMGPIESQQIPCGNSKSLWIMHQKMHDCKIMCLYRFSF